jgi:hypothetical protein
MFPHERHTPIPDQSEQTIVIAAMPLFKER